MTSQKIRKAMLVLAAVAVAVCAEGQTVRVLPAENLCMKEGRLERGVVLGELVPEARFFSYHSRRDIDSAEITGQVFDPKTMESIPYATVYAVHRDKDYVVDSVVRVCGGVGVHFPTPIGQSGLYAVHAVGYVPVLLEYEPPKMPEIVQVTRSEYESVDTTDRQTFRPEPVADEEYKRLADVVARDELDRSWLEDGEEWLEVGRFMPMGMPAVRVVAPIDHLRRFYLNGMVEAEEPVYADFAYALSPEGYFVGQVQSGGDLRVVWQIVRVDGYEQNEMPPIVFDTPPGHASEFRWAPGGWLYFRRFDEYYKLHVDIPVTQNCRMEDVEVSKEEFFDAMSHSVQQENMIRTDRNPDAADTAILRAWARKECLDFETVGEESEYVWYEPGYECIEIAIGDFCCTRLKGDTVDMAACEMALSAAAPRYFGGVNVRWGAGYKETPSYIYMYPLLPDGEHVGKPYIYQTTPSWHPIGRHYFWAADGWFYAEGIDCKNDRSVYHKVRVRQ